MKCLDPVPLEPGMVTMALAIFADGDTLVRHAADEPDCRAFGEYPHRMSECGMCDPPPPT